MGAVVVRARPADARGRLAGWRAHIPLVVICAVAALLYGWAITRSGYGNAYYSGAVRSMSQNLTALMFGSSDAANVVTVDKPPMALWPQVVSVWVFGYHGWAVLLPQVVEGVLAVALLHATVRRWAGGDVALLAAAVLALTPITVAINRDNNPDTLLTLFVIAAAYAVTRAVENGSTRWLLGAAALVGCGFTTKMLQAWMVVPAIALAYLLTAPVSWTRRVGQLAGAGVVLAVSSLWWIALVDLWPGPKPYIGGSTDGTAWNLVVGYNGLGRVGGGGEGGGGMSFAGAAGWGRLFNSEVGSQISWLLPFCGIVLATVAVIGVRRWRAGRPVDRTVLAGWILWGGWLVTLAVVLSFASGIVHPYYTTMMAPAIAAVAAAGGAVLWRLHRAGGVSGWLLPAALLATGAWAAVLVLRTPTWNIWTLPAVVLVTLAAVGTLTVHRLRRGAPRTGQAAMVLAVVAALLVPAVWSVGTAAAGSSSGPMASTNPLAGPGTAGGFGGFGMPGASGRPPSIDEIPPDILERMPAQVREQIERGELPTGTGPGPAAAMGGTTGTLTESQQRIYDYVTSHGGTEILLVVDGGANLSAPYVIATGATVVGAGGFSGADPVPTAEQLAGWVAQGRARYVLVSDGTGDALGQAMGLGTAEGAEVAAARDTWVKATCTAVNPQAYGAQAPSTDSGSPSGSQTLYDCG